MRQRGCDSCVAVGAGTVLWVCVCAGATVRLGDWWW